MKKKNHLHVVHQGLHEKKKTNNDMNSRNCKLQRVYFDTIIYGS